MSQSSEQVISSEHTTAAPAHAVAPRALPQVLAPTALLVGSLTAAAAALRFWRIGSQSYWEDEAVTVRLVHESLGRMLLHGIPRYETTPPLYYLLAWLWSRLFGSGEASGRAAAAGPDAIICSEDCDMFLLPPWRAR